jgi:glycosyltransferase involved in cell wall biosynthesis
MQIRPEISVVVPVYGCEECLHSLCDRLVLELGKISTAFEIILVVDNSPDNSWERVKEISASDNRVKGVLFSRNFGQHYAISAGLDFATGNWVAVMDCDLQDRPEDIPVLYAKASKGFDIVYGYSSFRGEKSVLRNSFRKLYIWLYDFMVQTNYKSENLSFFLMHSNVRDAIVQYREASRHISSIVREVGFKITSVPVEHLEREKGKSSYTFVKRVNMALVGLVTYSGFLLKISLFTGFSFSMVAFLFGLFIIFNRLFATVYYPGWASLAVLILFSTGLILSSLGILGIYLEKIFLEVKRRPLYIVKDKINL